MHALRCSTRVWRPWLTVALPSTSPITTSNSSPTSLLHTQPSRQHLSRQMQGVKVWEQVARARANDGTAESFDFEGVCNGVIANLQVNRYAKASTMTKIFDHVTTPEELNLAENALISFRRSLSRPTPALPLVVVRACIRVGMTKKALHYVRSKVKYGVFPSRRVYHILIDAFIREGDATGAVAVYDQMMADEAAPDRMTFHLAAIAYLMLNTPEGIKEAISLIRQCRQLHPDHIGKTLIVLVRALLQQGRTEDAHSLITQLGGDGKVGVAQEVWLQVQRGIQESGDQELVDSFEDLTRDMTIFRNLSLN